jgi:hypothetical protein
MGRVQYQPPAGQNYRLANLLGGSRDTYELKISDLIEERSDQTMKAPGGAVYLPSRAFARSLGIADPSTGGNLAGNGLMAVAAASRPAVILERLGAQRLEISGVGELSMPTWTPGAGGWIAEGVAAPALQTGTKSVTSSGRMAAARLQLSRRVVLQADMAERAVLGEVRAAVSSVLEAGFIAGSGSENQPLGLVNLPDAQAKTISATPTLAELVAMVEAAADENADLAQCVWLVSPADLAKLLKAQAGNAGPLLLTWQDNAHRLLGFPLAVSTHVPDGKVLFFDPTTVRLVFWDAPQLITDRFSSGKSLSGAVDVCVFNLADIAVLHPAQIVVGSA